MPRASQSVAGAVKAHREIMKLLIAIRITAMLLSSGFKQLLVFAFFRRELELARIFRGMNGSLPCVTLPVRMGTFAAQSSSGESRPTDCVQYDQTHRSRPRLGSDH